MTKDEALKLALEALDANYLLVNGTETHGGLEQCLDGYYSGCFDTDPINKQTEEAITAIKEALAESEQEPVKISHKHEWFRTGEMKVGQMRCISCGTWGQEEIPQRTWVGLTLTQVKLLWEGVQEEAVKSGDSLNWVFYTHINEALKEKNNECK